MTPYSLVLSSLLDHPLAPIRYKAHRLLEGPASSSLPSLRAQIPASSIVHQLLSERQPDGTLPHHPYNKWRGAHWVLAVLAEIGYPPGDAGLFPLHRQARDWIANGIPRNDWSPLIAGKYRRHASFEGYFLWYSLELGLPDDFLDAAAAELLRTQWPDGGWNCDKNPAAHTASLVESWLALRGLAAYQRRKPSAAVESALQRARQFFLERHLYLRRTTGEIIRPSFVRLAFPHYYNYTYLTGLKIFDEAGWISDARCQPALDLLEQQALPAGGWHADTRYYQHNPANPARCTPARWEAAKFGHANAFLTLEALQVLRSAGRWE